MKKYLLAAVLGLALTFCGAAAAEEDIMTPGDALQIYVLDHPDLSSTRANADSAYVVRPDGKVEFPLVGTIDCKGKSIAEFTEELRVRLSEYIINPDVTVNLSHLGTTRVFVLGEVNKPGMHELSKGHRVLDALGAAGSFTEKAAKKNIFLIRGGKEETMQKIKLNDFLYKGDTSQNIVLQEGDCLYLTGNHKLNFLKDIAPFLFGVGAAWNNVDEARSRHK